jgi:hypothetical protein
MPRTQHSYIGDFVSPSNGPGHLPGPQRVWISPDFAVPLDLDASYQTTCVDLRIRPAG